MTVLLVYIDDIIITINDAKEKQTQKNCLIKKFEMKEVERLKYFLRIEIIYSKQCIFISQQKYMIDLLKETGKQACKNH